MDDEAGGVDMWPCSLQEGVEAMATKAVLNHTEVYTFTSAEAAHHGFVEKFSIGEQIRFYGKRKFCLLAEAEI